MDFRFNEEEELFRSTVRKFCAQEVAPIVEEYEEREEFPIFLFQKFADQGFLGIPYPEEYGGAGGDIVLHSIFAEELGYVSMGIGFNILNQLSLATYAIYKWGSGELKQQYLVPVIQGKKIGSFSLTEPNVGSDVAAIQTRATRQGNEYIVNGSKTFITNGSICDYTVLAVVTDKSRGHRGISLLLVDKGAPGFQVARELKKMGVRCSNTAELVFEDCRVPADHLIGEENKGFYYLMGTLNEGRVTTAALAVGLARAALDAALAYAKERVQFGAPIGSYQAITFMLANMATEIELARSITYKAAWLTREELPEAAQIASMAKLYASEMVCRVVDKAVQIHGGYGYMREYPVERYYRDARALRFVEGTSEIQRRIIARSLGL